jgi:protein SCO1/2
VCAVLVALMATTAIGVERLPDGLDGVGISERLGEQVDRSLVFTDHSGQERTLGELMGDDGKPVLLTLNYYRCKMLCNLQLNALLDTLRGLGWRPGDQFRIVTVSIDPREGWELGRDKRSSYLGQLGKGDVDWTFAVGAEANIKALADSVGYSYAYDPVLDQYGHTAALFFLGPDGTIARYLYGLRYNARDVRFALMDASSGTVGSTVDRVILSCFYYDAEIGAYGPFAFGVMRLGGLMILTTLGMFLSAMWRIELKRAQTEGEL